MLVSLFVGLLDASPAGLVTGRSSGGVQRVGARWDIARKDEHIFRVVRLVKGHGVIFDPIKIHAISDPKLSMEEIVSSHFVVSLFVGLQDASPAGLVTRRSCAHPALFPRIRLQGFVHKAVGIFPLFCASDAGFAAFFGSGLCCV
jgi:hypothetical protein